MPLQSRHSLPAESTESKNTRAAVRYPVETPVVFGWIDKGGHAQEGRGNTLNISPHGLRVTAMIKPPRGASVSVKIFFPLLTGESRSLRVEADGMVLRVDRGGTFSAGSFSVQTRRMVLCAS